MTRKIVIFTERTKENQTYLVDFRHASEIYQYLSDIYIFLQSKARYYKIKKMMQSANRIKYKNNQLHFNMKGK
ncbi:TPA: hypothetical protein ACI0NX_001525 [Streptococcus agalactiae]|uniref:Uncharacterized protein n=1 Tax=Streptococcus canis TaxID=1329 RepID=A0A3P5XT76_STRCB|nr:MULTISPECIES: hypothetical protein [Streptococcus]QKG77599.1 hypothetical protein GE021_005420 [Streptococcus canis]TYL03667.1 hypothetical protein E0F70_03310 [Streptococcus dysgalactiae]VDC43738.1 hypothetical protein FMV2238Y02_22470 [Streptococcus canis]